VERTFATDEFSDAAKGMWPLTEATLVAEREFEAAEFFFAAEAPSVISAVMHVSEMNPAIKNLRAPWRLRNIILLLLLGLQRIGGRFYRKRVAFSGSAL
jgi:hypothetical protein